MLHHVDHLRPFARMALIALIAVSGVFFVCASSAAASDPVPVDEEHFPDDVFRAYVAQNIDTSGDTLLSDAEREAVTVINVKKPSGRPIRSQRCRESDISRSCRNSIARSTS